MDPTMMKQWWHEGGEKVSRDVEITPTAIETARAWVDKGYVQVSRKHRSIAPRGWGFEQDQVVELDFATFAAFRALKQEDAEEQSQRRYRDMTPRARRVLAALLALPDGQREDFLTDEFLALAARS